MSIAEKPITAEAFDEFVALPENAEKLFEFIAGEIVEVPSNPYVSKIAGLIITFINMYLFQNDLGHVTGEAGGYMVAGERYAPDVAFISYVKQKELAKSGYNPNPPDLAVEVISAENKAENDRLTFKLGSYLAAGVVVWIVRPESKEVEVHVPGQQPRRFSEKDTLDGGDVLPGLEIKVKDIFR